MITATTFATAFLIHEMTYTSHGELPSLSDLLIVDRRENI